MTARVIPDQVFSPGAVNTFQAAVDEYARDLAAAARRNAGAAEVVQARDVEGALHQTAQDPQRLSGLGIALLGWGVTLLGPRPCPAWVALFLLGLGVVLLAVAWIRGQRDR